MKKTDRVFMIFEFGVPNYRFFILEWISKRSRSLTGISGDDKFGFEFPGIKRCTIKFGKGENKLFIFNPFRLFFKDVVITTFNLRRPHSWMPMLVFPWKKWVLWGHGLGQNRSIFTRLLRKTLFRISDGFIVYTPKGKQRLIEVGYPSEKISVAYNTLSISNPGETKGEEYFLYFGRVQERKGLSLIIPYLNQFKYRLRVVGDGEHLVELVQLAEQHGVTDRIDFYPGTFDEKVIAEHFSGAVGYLSPQNLGLGVVHSFAYGV
ncbi:MAG: glycosyltransferase, partial [Idiomarina sp.]|nr:glycosyltransferase [Idiomarina sp.]